MFYFLKFNLLLGVLVRSFRLAIDLVYMAVDLLTSGAV